MRRIIAGLIAIGLLMTASATVAEEEVDEEAIEESEEAAEESEEAAEDSEEAAEEAEEVAEEAEEVAEEAEEVAEEAEEVAEDSEEAAEDSEEAAEEAEEVDDDPLTFAEPSPSAPSSHPVLAITPRIGVTAPQPFNDLNSWPVFGLDLGVILPFDVGSMERPLQIGLDAFYTRPGADGSGTHAMLGGPDDGGADYNWELQQQMLTLQMTMLWRFMAPGDGFGAHAIVGPRIYLMESILNADGNSGADFGENRETNSEFGVVFGGGVEYELGPGSVAGTLLVGGSPLDQRITGEANTAAVNVDAGYRLFF